MKVLRTTIDRWLDDARGCKAPQVHELGEEGCCNSLNAVTASDREPWCWFCPPHRFELNREMQPPNQDQEISAGPDLFVTHDIAPIVAGHLLIVSQPHISGLALASPRLISDIDSITNKIRRHYQKTVGIPTLFFEHYSGVGPIDSKCVDHLHVHCLPWATPVSPALAESLRIIPVECTIKGLKRFVDNGQPYLYLRDTDNVERLFLGAIPSQFMRGWFHSHKIGGARTWQVAASFDDANTRFATSIAFSRIGKATDRGTLN